MERPYERIWQNLQQTYPYEHQAVELMHAIEAEATALSASSTNPEAHRFWRQRLEEVRGKVIERSMLLQMR